MHNLRSPTYSGLPFVASGSKMPIEDHYYSASLYFQDRQIHLERQIDEICHSPQSTTTLGELVVLERTMLSLNGFEVESHSDEGSLPFLVGSSQSSSGDCQPPFYGR